MDNQNTIQTLAEHLEALANPNPLLGYLVLATNREGDVTLWGSDGNDAPFKTLEPAEELARSYCDPQRGLASFVVEVRFVKVVTA